MLAAHKEKRRMTAYKIMHKERRQHGVSTFESPDLELLRIYNRAMRVSEAVGNFRASIA